MAKEIERGLVRTSIGYIHYRSAGAGRAVVMMHQNAGSSTLFLELLEALPDNVRGIGIDLPSCGFSDHVDQIDIAGYARVVAEALAGIGVTKAAFFGAYGGAYIATELALTYPDLVDRIILVNTPWYPDKETEVKHHQLVDRRRATDETGWPIPVKLGEIYPPQTLDPPGCPVPQTQSLVDRGNVNKALAGRNGMQLVQAFENYDLPSNLARVQHPVMSLMGQYYRYAKYMDDVVRVPKNGTPYIVKDACSDVVTEQPADIASAIVSFLDK